MGNKSELEELQLKEKKYRAIFENAPVGISIIDKNRKIIEANHALEKVARISEDELKDRKYINRRYIHRDGSEFRKDDLPSSVAIKENRSVFNVEIGIEDKGEIIGWTEVSAAPVDFTEKCAVVLTQDITERKKLEKALKESEERYRAIFENSLDAILLTGPGGEIYSVNDAGCMMFGRSEADMCRLGRNCVVDINDPRLEQLITERLEKGKAMGELTMVRKDGSRFPAELSSTVFLNAEGKQMTSMIIRDITDRRHAEEEQLKQNEVLTKLNQFSVELSMMSSDESIEELIAKRIKEISGAEVATFTRYNHEEKSITTRYIDLEPGLLKNVIRILGIDPGRIKSKVTDKMYLEMTRDMIGIRKTMHEASFGAIPKSVGAAVQTLVNVDRFIGLAYLIEGKLYGISLLGMSKNKPDPSEQILLNFILLAASSLRRKLAESALSESEAAFRSIFDNSVMGISQAFPGGNLIRINRAYAEMYGYPDPTAMLKKVNHNTIQLYANPADREKVLKTLDKKGYLGPKEFKLKRRNGENFWALVGAKQVRDNKGKLLYLQAEHIDITELKIIENKLKESQNKYRNLSQHLEDILEKERSAIALNLHDDLGQKLTALDLDLAWIRGRIGVQAPPVKKKLGEMSLMINEIVGNIKEVSSFLRPSILFDLGLYPAVISLVKNFDKTTGISCNFQSDTEAINIDDHVSLIIYRVLQEALTNIARHSGASSAGIIISLSKNKIKMVVTDNGKGIEDDKINSVNSMGITGIRERVRAVRGKMQIKAGKESGTRIMVSIPLIQINND